MQLVVDHVVVLAHAPVRAQHITRAREVRVGRACVPAAAGGALCLHERRILGRRLAHGLAT